MIRNPVLPGFHPDPSIVRVGGWYYVANSSFEWFPTIPIHRSRDLVSWEYAGHVAGAAPDGDLHGVPDSGGIWAPSMSHTRGRFWVTYSIVRSVGTRFFDLDSYVTSAESIDGPWRRPVRVRSHGIDPALFHEDGRLWLLNVQNDHRPGMQRFNGIVVDELDPETLEPRGTTTLLVRRDGLLEGPKLLVRHGWYYLLLAENGTGVEHGVLTARSRNLLGPYELDSQSLLTSRDDPAQPLQKAGHGELVETSEGQWYLAHLASRPLRTPAGPHSTLGRETCLQKIVWVDGWPRLAHGGWHAAVDVPAPAVIAPAAGPVDGNGDGDGDGERHVVGNGVTDGLHSAVGWPWSTLREEASADWVDLTGRPGWIRLTGRDGPESRWWQSLLAQRITAHAVDFTVTVDADPATFSQSAGLVLWYDTTSYFTLQLTWAEPDGEPQRGQQWQGHGGRILTLVTGDVGGARQVARLDASSGTTWQLSASVDGAECQFHARAHGNDAWTAIGPVLDFSQLSDDYGRKLRFTGAMAGIGAYDLVDHAWTADFSHFSVHKDVYHRRRARTVAD
ncbi:family 43 glycosylhydrolase [Phytoactinopolyspora endophytica]|uniref:family 43 glycosylhydrolase n=1 Tax=Phytoactinopolyspora endophytica TaxID=1642495 RepID=UPI00197B4FB2|nr:family 43 glycosylhydrolase [Phytoactinopolyspora endophytica]